MLQWTNRLKKDIWDEHNYTTVLLLNNFPANKQDVHDWAFTLSTKVQSVQNCYSCMTQVQVWHLFVNNVTRPVFTLSCPWWCHPVYKVVSQARSENSKRPLFCALSRTIIENLPPTKQGQFCFQKYPFFYQIKDNFSKIPLFVRKRGHHSKDNIFKFDLLYTYKKMIKIYGATWRWWDLMTPYFCSFHGRCPQKTTIFFTFTDIKCPRTMLEKHPFSSKFRTLVHTHNQW